MGFCSKCGKKLSEDANFCPSCGARTKRGEEAGASIPADELRETFNKVGQEMEKAFSTAAKEMQRAFKTARENIQRTSGKEAVLCANCGGTNVTGASFCYKCGKKLD